MIQKLHAHAFKNGAYEIQDINVTYAQNAEYVDVESISIHVSYMNINS